LPLEAHVGENDGAALAGEGESLLEFHVSLLHQVSHDTAGAARDTGIAVDEDAPFSHSLPDEGNSSREVPDKLVVACIGDRNHFVFEVLGEERLDTVCHLEHVGDIGGFKA